MKLKYSHTDLFLVDDKYSLGHCISYDCKMGKGIALTFRNKYKHMPELVKNYLDYNYIGYPCTIAYRIDDNRYVFNLITKEFYYNKPSYNSLRQALIDLKMKMVTKNIKYIAIPKIGCGLDLLSWNRVEKIIKNVFKDTDIEILVCDKK